jgi:hypothetical protein
MTDGVEFLTRGVLIGLGAAALMDAWALVARRAFSIQGLDYALLGRWIGLDLSRPDVRGVRRGLCADHAAASQVLAPSIGIRILVASARLNPVGRALATFSGSASA